MEGVEPAHVLVPLLQDADLLDGALAVLVPSEVVPHWMCEQLTLMLFLLEPAFFFLGQLELLLEELVVDLPVHGLILDSEFAADELHAPSDQVGVAEEPVR